MWRAAAELPPVFLPRLPGKKSTSVLNLKVKSRMGRPQKYRGTRLTQPPQQSRFPRRKEDGRPPGTYKKYKFEETRLGFLLKYEVPAVYSIIMNLTPKAVFPEPKVELIEQVCRASGDPSLRKPKFYRYLEEYRMMGIYCRRPKRLTPERKLYYEKVRKKKLERFIRENQEIIRQELQRMRGLPISSGIFGK